jgi:peptidoglycan/xylan/chitin deacetylase (PgdA/CDA1 family)
MSRKQTRRRGHYDNHDQYMKTILFSTLVIIFYCGCQHREQDQPAKPPTPKILPSVARKDTALKHIYITFDDGPLEGSEDIDDAVRQEKINVNVFVVGEHALSNDRMKSYYKLYRQNPYIEVGNHSFTHAHEHYKRFYLNPSAVVADFQKCQTELKIPTDYARLPGRNQWRLNKIHCNDIRSGSSSADSLYQDGFKVFGWDVEWQHNGETGDPIQSVDQMVSLIEKRLNNHKTMTQNNLVLLAHDEMFRNGWEESELKQLIDKLKAKGNYSFDHLSSYPD